MILRTALLLSVSSLASGCLLGEGTEQPARLLCSAELAVTGTFQPSDGAGGGTDPEDPDSGWSCIPSGRWTVDVAVVDTGDCDEVPIQDRFTYTITPDTESARGDYLTVYDGDPEGQASYTKVTIEGPCIGNFEHFSPDGKEATILRPYVDTEIGFDIAGTGVFELYSKSVREDPNE